MCNAILTDIAGIFTHAHKEAVVAKIGYIEVRFLSKFFIHTKWQPNVCIKVYVRRGRF